jgi:hypothetical protein
MRLAADPLRGGQQHLVEVTGMKRVAERRGAVGVANDRLAQIDPSCAQRPRRPLGATQRRQPAGGEVDGLVLARGQRRDQQRVGDGAAASMAPQLGDQSRVLGGAGGNDQRLPVILVLVDLHLGLLRGGDWKLLRGSARPPSPGALTKR